MVLLPSLSGELSDSPRKRGPVALGRARAACGREHAGPWQARSAARRCEGTSSQEPPQQRRRTSLGRRPGLSFVGSSWRSSAKCELAQGSSRANLNSLKAKTLSRSKGREAVDETTRCVGRDAKFSCAPCAPFCYRANSRSEEHTSELQSRFDLVCRLL